MFGNQLADQIQGVNRDVQTALAACSPTRLLTCSEGGESIDRLGPLRPKPQRSDSLRENTR